MVMDYKQIAYQKQNLNTIKSFYQTKKDDKNLNMLLDELHEYLGENHEGLIEEIVLKKKSQDKLEKIINDWLVKRENSTTGYLQDQLVKKLIENIIGWGKIHELIEDESITNIFTNEKLEVIKRVAGEDIKTNIKFDSSEELENFIRGKMIRTGEKINHNLCIKDAMDPLYNIRINAGINGSPVKKEVVRSPYIALRLYRVKEFKSDFFINNGTFNEEINSFFNEYLLESNIAIVGEPDAGKSTLIDYLQITKQRREPMRRVIVIEEEAELGCSFENSVAFFERKIGDNTEDTRKKYDMSEFAKIATRLAGKDVVIGEVRGPEAWYLFRLLCMGYKGMYSIHGYSAEEAIHQTVFLASLVTSTKPEILTKRMCEVLDFVIHISQKKIVTIAEVIGYDQEAGNPQLNTIFDLEIDSSGKLAWRKGKISDEFKKKNEMRKMLKNRKV